MRWRKRGDREKPGSEACIGLQSWSSRHQPKPCFFRQILRKVALPAQTCQEREEPAGILVDTQAIVAGCSATCQPA